MIYFPQLYIVQMWCYECSLHGLCANCVQLLCVLCHSDVEADTQGEELLPSLQQGEAAPPRARCGHGGQGHGADGGHEPSRGELSGEVYLCEDETPYSLLNC